MKPTGRPLRLNAAGRSAALATILLLAALSAFGPRPASAGFTETMPASTFMLDVSYTHSWLSESYDNGGNRTTLIKEIERYEPGGGKQGVLIPNVDVQYQILLMQLQYGILDNLSLGIGIPLVLRTRVVPDFGWEEGSYQPQLGRPYSQDDFWSWASSMGQPKPGTWEGNKAVLSDLIVGARLRFSDWIAPVREAGVGLALMVSGAIPTGKQADPENPLAAGTTMWDLHSQGDIGIHLSLDKSFKESLDDRLILGLDLFYEVFLPHTYKSAKGEKNPLLLGYRPYVGHTYTIDPGDFLGFSVQTDVVAVKGPARATWLSGQDEKRAEKLPPLLTVSLRYTFCYLLQSDWESKSDLWDYDQETRWRPGYKNILSGTILLSFLRLGAPLQVYASYRTLRLIPGRNTRAADILAGGIRIPLKFW